MKKHINIILTVVITFITVIAIYGAGSDNRNIYVNSTTKQNYSNTTTPAGAGYIFDDKYNIIINTEQ